MSYDEILNPFSLEDMPADGEEAEGPGEEEVEEEAEKTDGDEEEI